MTTIKKRGGNDLPYVEPMLWSDPTSGIFFGGLSDVEVQVVGAPGVNYTPQRSFDNGTTWVAANAYDKDGTTVTAISAAGIYSIDGGCMVRLNGGSGSTVYVRAGV